MFLNFLYMGSAFAQAASPQAVAQPSMMEMLLPFVFIFAVFYFFIIRPQSKRQKDHQTFVSNLQRGDSVVTSGGMVGIIKEVGDQFISLEVADGVVVKFIKNQVLSSLRNQQEAKSGKS